MLAKVLFERDEYIHFTSCKSIVASPPIKKVGLTLDWDKMHSQHISLASINLCVRTLFSRVQSAE